MKYRRSTLLLILIALAFSSAYVIPSVDAEAKSAETGDPTDDWPMFHHDLNHTGYSTSTAPNTNTTLWTYTTGGQGFSSPAVSDGRLYIGSSDQKVYCLNASTGVKIWNYTTGNSVESSPAISGGRVYIGSSDHKVYCLNASTGILMWNYTTGNAVTSSPAVSDGRVYVSFWDEKIYCLNATSSSANLLWTYNTRETTFDSSPTVAYGRVYVGAGNYLYVLNATTTSSTGQLIWKYNFGSTTYDSSPAVYGGRVYIGAGSYVYALNATTSTAPATYLWGYLTGGTVYGSPAIAYSNVFFGSRDSYVYSLNATFGALAWRYQTGGSAQSPAIADGKVYVGFEDHKVYSLNASTGTLIWSYTTGSYVYSSPAVADGKVFIGSCDGKVYAFGRVAVDLNLRTVDWIGSILPSCNVTVVGIRSTISSASGWANFTVQSGTYVVNVYWQGSKVNEISITLGASSVTMDIKSKVWTLTIYARDSSGNLLSPTTTQMFITFPNGTHINSSGINTASYRVMNGTFYFRVKWQGNWVSMNISTYLEPLDRQNLFCKVYSLSFIFKNNAGTYIINPSQIVVETPNGTLCTLTSYTSQQVQNGTWALRQVLWQGDNVVPTPNPTKSLTANTTWTINCKVYYSLTIDPAFYDNVGSVLQTYPSKWTILFPNGTLKVVSSTVTYNQIPSGVYSITGITWKGINVVPTTPPSITLSHVYNVVWTPSINCLLPTSLSISLGSSTSFIGFQVKIDGNLTRNDLGVAGAQVLLSYSVTGGKSWNDLTLVNTDHKGSYSVTWTPSTMGNYLLRAVWAGNSTFPSSNTSVNLTAKSFEESVFSVTPNSTVSELAFNSTSRELSFTVNGPTGTTGFAKVPIAKNLVSNIAGLKVYLDSSEIDYTANSIGDAWLLYFTYQHTKHSVRINLGTIIPIPPPPFYIIFLTQYGLPIGLTLTISTIGLFLYRRKRSMKPVEIPEVKPIEIVGGYEPYGELLKVGIKVTNNSETALINSSMTLDSVPDALSFEDPDKPYLQLGNIIFMKG